MPGPGADFFDAMKRELGTLPFIAEDLGVITPDVVALRDRYEIPGTRVLQFGFDGASAHNTVVYTGTHDNNTTRGWFETLPEDQRRNVWKYLRQSLGESRGAAPALRELAWSSGAALAMAPLQDLLNLGADARMNTPGRIEGNWGWRCSETMLSSSSFEWLRDMTEASNGHGLSESVPKTAICNPDPTRTRLLPTN
jgi:4-alpha-glucanotransferase